MNSRPRKELRDLMAGAQPARDAQRLRDLAAELGIPTATLASIRPGPNGEPATHVVVPREPTGAELAALEIELSAVLSNVSYIMPVNGMARVRAAMLAATDPAP